MTPAFRQFTPRTFWTVSAWAAVVLIAIVAIPQWLSKQARLEVLRAHVAEVARLAASVIDGDLHRQLIDPEQHTGELYQRTLAPLVRFHSAAPEIFYVYTMVERDGKSHFVVDTAASANLVRRRSLRASKYMEPFAMLDAEPEPDWLQQIAAGKTYVYPRFQRDAYGNFLSGHTPIYDSAGRYAGFVGVDFDIGYYLAQEASFRAISIGTVLAALLVSLLIGYLAARYHFDLSNRIDVQYRLSIRDELTQLLNRRGAMTAVREAFARRAPCYAAVLVDVDDLKGINDNHGHAAGDDFLVQVAGALRSSAREGDICARLGGDEFLIFSPGADLESATRIASAILAAVPSRKAPDRAQFGVSIGIDVSSATDADFETMYRRADQALYRAKTGGRNRYVIFDPLAA